jgi:mono/diheme cytochrome c family protein
MLRAALVVLLFGVLSPAVAGAQTAAVERGMKVYAESKCSMCHSIAGKGNAKGVLDNIGAKLSEGEMRQWLADPQAMRDKTHAERKPVMKSFASLSKGDVDALVAYLQTLKEKKYPRGPRDSIAGDFSTASSV